MVNHLNRAEPFHRIPACIHVLCNSSLRYGLQLLMNHCKPLLKRLIRVSDAYFLSVQINLTFIHVVNTKEAFHQGGFSCTVLSHQRVNRTRTDLQVNLIQSLNARKALRYPAHFQSVLCHPILSFHKIGCAKMTHPTHLLIISAEQNYCNDLLHYLTNSRISAALSFVTFT